MIQVSGLHYRYPGAPVEAVRGLEFQVEPGEIFGLLGPSGAGKSTAQRVLTGALRDYQGSARVFGAEVRGAPRSLYNRLGVGFEFPNVYTRMTARENLRFFAAFYQGPTASPDALLEQVGLLADADTRVSDYSKGMKMRLGFCRAFLNQPELVFLDEPTSGQDPGNARRIRGLIREARDRGVTVFLTTHDMHVAAELCDRVAFMVDGAIAAIDDPRTLMLQHGRRRLTVEYREADALRSQEFPLEGLADDGDFLALLRGGIEAMHSQEATLEDVFLDVTGRRLT
ncbi:MAG: ABC transporter ATP-binding protein [Alphaproteobacteria bacterium]|nr:ABC transporter ATP-binding protein [Alphaproteobacteria bacterium]